MARVLTSYTAFFAGNNRFYIRGVDYQPGKTRLPFAASSLLIKIPGGSSDAVDPIADKATCTRDIVE